MADYIYLLQNRLVPAQWRALEAVREAARVHGMPVFLVGGAVRDLTTGSPVRDLDFAVQGDPRTLLPDMEPHGVSQAGENPTYGSIYLTFRGGVRAELAPTLSVSYPKPGQAETQSAVILDDLRRRDFTANAMAISLNEGSYGLLLDPLNGTADLENRELRLVSAYGFIEQPALLLRAARLSERLGWNLEERTQTRYNNSKEEGHIEALPEFDRNYELEELFHEEDPVRAMEHLAAEGWLQILFPTLRPGDVDQGTLDSARDLIGQLEGQGLHPDPSAVNFPAITAKLSEADRAELKSRMVRQGFVGQIESIEARSKELAGQLTSKQSAQPSDTWRLLMDAEPEVVLYLALHSRSGAVQGKLKAFLKEWPQMRQRIPYALMQEMRISPELPGYPKLLEDLFFALIDGKLDTPEATRAFLEPYSPPAPPQVNVRRRPAKATRSRTKKAAGQAAEPIDTQEDEAASEGPDQDTEERAVVDEDDDEDAEGEGEMEATPVAAKPAEVAVKAAPTSGPTGSAPKRKASAEEAVAASPDEGQGSGAGARMQQGSATAGAKAAATKGAPTVAAKAPAKAAPTNGGKAAKTPAKTGAAAEGKVLTEKGALPAKKSSMPVAAKATTTKQAGIVKGPPAKAAAAKGAVAVKVVPKKQAPPASKAVVASKPVAKKAAVPVPAKRVAAKAVTPVAAKKSAPTKGAVKTAKKAAKKGSSR